jgi:hypothetical protein
LYTFDIWLPWAIIAMVIGRLLLRWWSLITIQKYQKISFNWRFFFWNMFVIMVLCGIFLLWKKRVFVINDISRRKNIIYLICVIIAYYWILAGINYKSIKALFREIKTMKA